MRVYIAFLDLVVGGELVCILFRLGLKLEICLGVGAYSLCFVDCLRVLLPVVTFVSKFLCMFVILVQLTVFF